MESKTSNKMREQNKVFTHDAGGDTDYRWYCYYYTAHDDKKARVRIYGNINREKDPHKRKEKLLILQQMLQNKIITNNPGKNTLLWYMKRAITDKTLYLKESSRISFKTHVNVFNKWLIENNYAHIMPDQLTGEIIHLFQNYLLATRTNRTVNNYLDTIKTACNFIKTKYKAITENPCLTRTQLPTQSEMHVAYTDKQAAQISAYLETADPELLFYIRFIYYCFLRCVEVRKLRIRDIDFGRMIIKMETANVKTNASRHKKILADFHNQVITLKDLPGHYFVFGRTGQPGPLKRRAKYFAEKFKPVKQKFELSRLHTMYGFRHTVVSQLIRNGADKFDVMKYTGHTTLAAFENYIRSIYAIEPRDLSDKVSVKI